MSDQYQLTMEDVDGMLFSMQKQLQGRSI